MSQVESGIDRDDIYEIRLHTQRAQKRIMQDYSWTWMQMISQQVMLSGNSFMSLPVGFKEFQRAGRGPLNLVDSVYGYLPVEILAEGRHLRGGIPGYYASAGLSKLRVWLEYGQNSTLVDTIVGAPARIRMFFPVDADLTFECRTFNYLPIATLDTDSNVITTDHTELLINKATALCYETVGDPAGLDFEKRYQNYLQIDKKRDAYQNVSGVTLRMGG